MKRLPLLAMIWALILSLLSPALAAAPTAAAGSGEGGSGDEVALPVTLTGNPGLASLMLQVEFDHSCLELRSVEFSPAFRGEGELSAFHPETGVLNWVRARGNNTADGLFATLHFHIAEDAPTGETAVVLRPVRENIFDRDFRTKLISTRGGAVRIHGRPTLAVEPRSAGGGLELSVRAHGIPEGAAPLELAAALYEVPDGPMLSCRTLPVTADGLLTGTECLRFDCCPKTARWKVFLLEPDSGRPVLPSRAGGISG